MLERPLVLCYHAASATWPYRLSLPPETIQDQIRSVQRRGFASDRAAAALAGRGRLLHVTFDDAFASIAPVVSSLAARGVYCTVFVCTGLADRDGAALDVPELGDELRDHPDELATLSWGALSELASDPHVEIGSHTVSHAKLWDLSDHEVARELRDSKANLEDRLGRPCRYLAYPYGIADDRAIRAAEREGYDAAFLLLNGESNRRYAYPRIDLYPPDRGLRLRIKTEPVLSLSIARLLRWKRTLAASRHRGP